MSELKGFKTKANLRADDGTGWKLDEGAVSTDISIEKDGEVWVRFGEVHFDFQHVMDSPDIFEPMMDEKLDHQKQIEECREPDLPYISSSIDADERIMRGEKQEYCVTCHRWQWWDLKCEIFKGASEA